MLGLARGVVQVVPYSPAWADLFRQECARLQAALVGHASDIQHIGSTAVPGLAAKPILDIGIAVTDIASVGQCIPLMEGLGYAYRGERGQSGDHLFAKGPDDRRTHYAHLMQGSDPAWQDCLRFRDYLIAHPQARDRYLELKRQLAARHADHRASYTDGKAGFIREILAASRSPDAAG